MNRLTVVLVSFILVTLQLTSFVAAVNWYDECRDGDQLFSKTNVNGVDYNNTIKCTYGCDNVTRACKPATYETNLILLGGVVLSLFVVGLIIKRLK